MFSRFFIDRPILASVPSIIITLAGLVAVYTLPVSQYPEITPPTVRVSCTYPGASAQVVADTVAAPIEQQVNGVEDMLYMLSQSSNDGTYPLTRDVQGGHEPEHGPGAGAEPRQPGHAHAPGRGQADRRDHDQAVARPDDDHQPGFTPRAVRRALSEQLRLDPGAGRVDAARRSGRRLDLRPARLQHARLARSRPPLLPQPHRRRRGQGAAGAERAGGRGTDRPATGRQERRLPVHHDHAGPADRAGAVRRHHRQDRRRRPDHPPGRPGAGRVGGQEPGHRRIRGRRAGRRHRRLSTSRQQRPGNGRPGEGQDGRVGPAVS